MRIWKLVIVLSVFWACGEKEKWSDEYKQSLADLMKEVQVVEVAVNEFEPVKRDSIELIYYEQFYAINNISKDSLEEIFSLLRMNPVLAEEVYKRASEIKNVK